MKCQENDLVANAGIVGNDFDFVSFGVDDNSGIVAVAGCTGSAYDDNAISLELLHHVINVFAVADAD